MNRVLVTVTAVGALTFSVWMVAGGTPSQQTAFLADAGITQGNRVATCPVRIDDDCLAVARDAGIDARKYERLRFPVFLTVLPDAGRDVQLPPMRAGVVRACIEVVDWSDCTLDTNATYPAVASLWGNALPFRMTGVTRKCVRPNFDAGLACNRVRSDGGVYSFGDRNVYPRNKAFAPATCEPVECVIFFGDNPEVDL